jgi:hypothetical protein
MANETYGPPPQSWYPQQDQSMLLPPHQQTAQMPGHMDMRLSGRTMAIIALLVGLGAALLGVYVLWQTTLDPHTPPATQAQVTQLKHELAAMSAKEARDDAALNKKVGSVNSTVTSLAPLSKFTGDCTADATGPKGVAVYEEACVP